MFSLYISCIAINLVLLYRFLYVISPELLKMYEEEGVKDDEFKNAVEMAQKIPFEQMLGGMLFFSLLGFLITPLFIYIEIIYINLRR